MREFDALWDDLDSLSDMNEIVSPQSAATGIPSHPNETTALSRLATCLRVAASSVLNRTKTGDSPSTAVDDRAKSGTEGQISKTP
jgi:hypothetical protein